MAQLRTVFAAILLAATASAGNNGGDLADNPIAGDVVNYIEGGWTASTTLAGGRTVEIAATVPGDIMRSAGGLHRAVGKRASQNAPVRFLCRSLSLSAHPRVAAFLRAALLLAVTHHHLLPLASLSPPALSLSLCSAPSAPSAPPPQATCTSPVRSATRCGRRTGSTLRSGGTTRGRTRPPSTPAAARPTSPWRRLPRGGGRRWCLTASRWGPWSR